MSEICGKLSITTRGYLLIAIGVTVHRRAFVETIIIVNSTIAARCLYVDLIDDLWLLGGGRDDGREGIVDVTVGNDVVIQLVQYCRQITWRSFAYKR